MSPLQKYERYLSKLRRQQDALKTASSVDEAKDNLIQLHAIANKLLSLAHRVTIGLNKMKTSLQRKKETPLASSLFQKSKRKEQEDAQVKLMRGIKRYELMLADINTVRTVVGKVTIPNLAAYISQNQHLKVHIAQNQYPKADIAQNQLDQPELPPPNYHKYIRSEEWRVKAEEAKALAGNRCQFCNRSRGEIQLEAHHRTYERLGNEQPGDITVLCRNCHQTQHEGNKKIENAAKKCQKCGKSFTPTKSSYYYCPSCYRQNPKTNYKNNQQRNTQIVRGEKGHYSATPQSGVCIRCHTEIKLNPHIPYCYSCFKNWKRYGNNTYQEKFCHICGKAHQTSMAKPVCLRCYRKSHGKL